MFHIFTVIKDGLPIIRLQNSDKATTAIINLEQGGRLQELTLLGKSIMKKFPILITMLLMPPLFYSRLQTELKTENIRLITQNFS